LDRIEQPSITPCGHLFDKASLKTAIKHSINISGVAKCPVCRERFDKSELNSSAGIKKWHDRESKQWHDRESKQ
jgi:hypothetical protein